MTTRSNPDTRFQSLTIAMTPCLSDFPSSQSTHQLQVLPMLPTRFLPIQPASTSFRNYQSGSNCLVSLSTAKSCLAKLPPDTSTLLLLAIFQQEADALDDGLCRKHAADDGGARGVAGEGSAVERTRAGDGHASAPMARRCWIRVLVGHLLVMVMESLYASVALSLEILFVFLVALMLGRLPDVVDRFGPWETNVWWRDVWRRCRDGDRVRQARRWRGTRALMIVGDYGLPRGGGFIYDGGLGELCISRNRSRRRDGSRHVSGLVAARVPHMVAVSVSLQTNRQPNHILPSMCPYIRCHHTYTNPCQSSHRIPCRSRRSVCRRLWLQRWPCSASGGSAV